jgi:mono/diheme cytochrome c family protein
MRRIIFALGICFLVVLSVGACYAAWMIRRGFTTRVPPGAVETSLATSMRTAAFPSRYKSMPNPLTATPDVMREGMEHWADHCSTCHANNGSGDTMYGKAMYPRPPDMRRKETQDLSDGELYYTIQNGIMLSGMPGFGSLGDNDLDSWKLVVFIRHLPALSQSEEAEMEKMNPKSPQEMQEEQDEENFLKGTPSSSPHH